LAFRFNQLDGRLSKQLDAAEPAAADVIRNVDQLDAEIIAVAENWRLERIGVVERNILRLALHEMRTVGTPAKVAIDEAVKLAHWFAGSKAPGFINGVLDALARKLGYL
jgi:N utilization substance protein B